MSWDRTAEKFHWLSEAFASEDLRSRLIKAVQQLDTTALSDLMDLFAFRVIAGTDMTSERLRSTRVGHSFC